MHLQSTRRTFLQQASASAFSAGILGGLNDSPAVAQQTKGTTAVAPDKTVICDTHLHLWDLSKFKLPWTKGKGLETLDRSFLIADFLTATQALNVKRAVYMEVDVLPVQQTSEAEYVIALCEAADTPMQAAVISGRPASAEFAAYIGNYKESPYIKGVRQVLHVESTPAGFCLEEPFVKGITLLGELGKSFDLCMRAGELADAVALVKKCPKTRFILDHCGNMPVQSTDEALRTKWKAGVAELAQCENVVCKISGIVASAKPREWKAADLAPVIGYCLEQFGKDRVMFGGDWPVCTLTASYKQWVAALKEIVRGESGVDRSKLFHDNAVKFYGLK